MPENLRLTVLLLCGVVAIGASPLTDYEDSRATKRSRLRSHEFVHVRLIRHHDDHRVKRDVGESQMPDVLVMKFTLEKEDVVFRLQRTSYPNVFLVKADGVEKITPTSSAKSVYVDPSRDACFRVKQTGSDNFLLDGHFGHSGRQLLMKPELRRRRSPDDNSTNHVITPLPLPERIEYEHNFQPIGPESSQQGLPESMSERRLSKRQARVAQHVVETSFVVDHTDYAEWVAKFPDDTMNELTEYFTYIAQSVNNIYSSVNRVDGALDIRVAVIALYVVESSDNAITMESSEQIEGRDYLDDFRDWIATQPDLPSSDHYTAFTAYDLTFNGGAAVGVAESAKVCTRRSVSVVENSFSASVANVVAHEMGHTLSAGHDGEGNSCSPREQNVMTASFSVPPGDSSSPRDLFTFSTCSIHSFKTYLNRVTCTQPQETSARLAIPFTDFNHELITNRDLQCRLATDYDQSAMCNPNNFEDYDAEDICFGMLCRLRTPRNQCRFVLPFEGTPCGSNKVCSRGLCVNASTAVQYPATFGERSTRRVPSNELPTTPSTRAPTRTPPTQAPTRAPATQAPTRAPPTQAPTRAPATQAPITKAPATEAPRTRAPLTKAPSTTRKTPTVVHVCTLCRESMYKRCWNERLRSRVYGFPLSTCCQACLNSRRNR